MRRFANRMSALALAAVGWWASAPAFAAASPEGYPSRPIRVIVPYPAAGGPDIVTRRVAESLRARLGHSVVVDNRSGAAGGLGLQIAARALPDGYTLAYVSASHVAPEILGAQTNLRRDFVPVVRMNDTPSVLVVRGNGPYKSVDGLLKDLRARPGKLAYGSSGVGNASHLATGLLASLTGGFAATHVPYRGGIETLPPLIDGQLDFCIVVVPVTLPHIASGRIRALAVTLGERFPGLPEVPTFEEVGVKGYRFSSWGGLVAPRGVSMPIVDLLHREITAIVADAQTRETLIKLGSVAYPGASPDVFKAMIDDDYIRLAKVVRDLGLKAE
ncbi:MAG: tripartite tricarboxylate transporter substrate binding protein [Burkholderiales bacterium]|nr:tripartite tricarboxylate transporter substrate binding protein [Burkholderiales bacterium]